MDKLDRLCQAYINDELTAEERKDLEQRIYSGDQDVLRKLHRLQKFPDHHARPNDQPRLPDDPHSDLSHYLNEESQADSSASSGTPNSRKSKKTSKQAHSNPFHEDRKNDKSSNRLVHIAGIITALAILFALFLLWEKIGLQQQVSGLTTRNTKLEQQTETLINRLQHKNSRLDRVKAILSGENVEFMKLIPNSTDQEPPFERAHLIWDRSTLRTAGMFVNPDLDKGTVLNIWTQNNRGQWNRAGHIDELRSDSLYTDFNNEAMRRAQLFNIYLDTTIHSDRSTPPDTNQTQLLISFSME